MKTTIEIEDVLFRRIKAVAAATGVSLKDFVTQALRRELEAPAADETPSWRRHFGKLGDLRAESKRVLRHIEEAFEFQESRQPI